MLMFILMIAAFIMLLGGALLYVNILRLNIGEGFVLSTVTLIAIIYFTGLHYQNLLLGRNIYCIIALLGLLITTVQIMRHQFAWEKVLSGYLPILLLVLIGNFILYYGDYIHYADELHYWALIPKQMLRTNQIPEYAIGSNLGTCMFHYFFQTFTGHNEGIMYSSGTLLSWIAFLLPISNIKERNEWIKVALFVSIIYIAMPTLYAYGLKSLYVDIPVAAWLGGLAGWYINREKKWQNTILIVAVMWAAYAIKDYVGLALDLFFAFLCLITFLNHDRGKESLQEGKVKRISLLIIMAVTIIMVVGTIVFLEHYDLFAIMPESIKAKLATSNYSFIKVDRTVNKIITVTLGSALGVFSAKLKITYIGMIVICIIIILVFGFVSSRIEDSFSLIVYTVVTSLIYWFLTVCTYIFKYHVFHAYRAWSCARYLSIHAIFLFTICLSLFLTSMHGEKNQHMVWMTNAILLLVFAYGIRSESLNYMTSVNKDSQGEYEIQEQKKQAETIKSIIGKQKSVYFLNQEFVATDDFGIQPALYYLEGQIDDTLTMPSQYSEAGALIRHYLIGTVKLTGFPQILSDGKFDYVWLYKTNSYLNKALPTIVNVYGYQKTENGKYKGKNNTSEIQGMEPDNPANMMDGQLYRIVYNKQGEVEKLVLEENLVSYNNRQKYFKQ